MMKNGDTMIAITTPAGINYAHLLALRGAIRLETLGLKRRGTSALSVYKRHYNPKCRTAKQALAEMNDIVEQHRVFDNLQPAA